MKRKYRILIIATGVLIAPVLLSPMPEFRKPLSTVVYARDGSLLGARIAGDGQWRFPPPDSVPEKFARALVTYEDKYFRYHPGINPVSVVRAAKGNMKAGKVISGGSTITMQVARLARGNRPRTYGEKIIEAFMALKLDLFRSKKYILKMYAANAPFGGNTVGLEAAAWRYMGLPSSELSWAQAATLAILPNSPSLVFPGKNHEKLKMKRDRLLRELYKKGYFDDITLSLSVDEPLPGPPGPIPVKAPHLTTWYSINAAGRKTITTIDPDLQERVSEIINNNQKTLVNNFIYNSACLVVEVKTGKVLAYAGNTTIEGSSAHGGDVDIIRAKRSTGSILKPILYAGMQQSGMILPNSLVADIPTRFQGFSPENFDNTYSGAVTADQALSQSLNIPSVRMLQAFGEDKFLYMLRNVGFTSFTREADYYGLSLILGGGEASLWELAGVYSSLSRVLNRFNNVRTYSREDYHMPYTDEGKSHNKADTSRIVAPLSAPAIWLTYEALQHVNRPEAESGWQYFSSSRTLAWKTGTSFGFRDAWAVGTTPEYVVAVWAGNASGEGRPGLTGVASAAPVMFEVFNILGSGTIFTQPDGMTTIKVCSESGFRAGPDCPDTKEIWASETGLRSETCPYHTIIHLNKTRTERVNSSCVDPSEIINEKWFILPPAIEYYYRLKNPAYKTLPPLKKGCIDDRTIAVMEFVYPARNAKIFIPRDQEGKLTRIVPEVAHRDPSKKIHWHLDNNFVTTTRFIHKIELLAGQGSHVLTAVDEDGNSIKCPFTISNRLGGNQP
ncbi:MAG: penicillin-binding protein 1C [Bacteroidales bacterium]